MNAPGWSEARNVLCARLDFPGDVLICTPAIRAIKQAAKDRRVTLLTSADGAAVTPFVPEIDAAIEYEAPWIQNGMAHRAGVDMALVHALRDLKFDAAVIFTSFSQSALPASLLCYLADIPLRLAHCRENPHRLLTDWAPDPEPGECMRRDVRRQLDLVAGVGYPAASERLSFQVRESDIGWVRLRLLEAGIDLNKRWILLHPGAAAGSRPYPAGHWSQVVRHLGAGLGYDVVLTGGVDESEIIDEIRRASGSTAHTLAGQLDLGKLGAAIALASVVISNNILPAQVAEAIGTPLVDLCALTYPPHARRMVQSRMWYHDLPHRDWYRNNCQQEHHACLAGVEPAQVVDATVSILRAMPGADALDDSSEHGLPAPHDKAPENSFQRAAFSGQFG